MRPWLALVLAAVPPAAASADPQLACSFSEICSLTEPCMPAPDDARLTLSRTATGAVLAIEGEPETAFRRVSGTPDDGPETMIGLDPDTGGAAMLSLYADGTVAFTIHGVLFGPLVLTAFGSCMEPAE